MDGQFSPPWYENLTMIPLFTVNMPEEVLTELKEIIFSGYVGQGKVVDQFESLFSGVSGTNLNLSVNSCTSALQLSLRLAEVGFGDEVITTPMTCTATNFPILACGGKIVWADIDPRTGLISPEDVEKKITKKTKAVICVNWGGMPCDLKSLDEICKKHNLKLIQDAAHSIGAKYESDHITKFSDFTCYSFQAIKHITTIDGGMLSCRSEEDYKLGKLLRWYGIDRETPRDDFRCESDIVDWGYKFHMNDITARIGITQLKYLGSILNSYKENHKFLIDSCPNIKFCNNPAYVGYEYDGSSWLCTLLCKNPADRENFISYMNQSGIQTSQVHARNDLHTVCKPFRKYLPGVDEFSSRQVSIPTHNKITTLDIEKISVLVGRFFE